MAYKKTLKHKFLDWQLARIERKLLRMEKWHNFLEGKWKKN